MMDQFAGVEGARLPSKEEPRARSLARRQSGGQLFSPSARRPPSRSEMARLLGPAKRGKAT
eukprot:6417472-Alexandrium_andersonii.AAC.1